MEDIRLTEEEWIKYTERVAICQFEGGLSEDEAKKIAMQGILANKTKLLPASGIKLISAKELVDKDIPPLMWIVPGLLPEGICSLASRPKTGKSLLCLNIALDISTGKEVLGHFPVEQQTVLYISYEDSERRLRDRVKMITEAKKYPFAPERLWLTENFPTLDSTGLQILSDSIDEKNIKLVIIDTLSRALPAQTRISYEIDYLKTSKLHEFAESKRISLLAVQHTRKMSAENPLDEVQGTTDITAGLDTNMVLKRSQSYFKLHFTGRDVIENDMELEFDKSTCIWRYRGISSSDSTPERREILDLLASNTEPMALKDIADRLGKTTPNINILLKKLIEEGQVRKEKTGYYTIVI